MPRLAFALLLATLALVPTVAVPGGPTLFFASTLPQPGPIGANPSTGAEPDILVTASGVILIGDTAGIHRSVNGVNWLHRDTASIPGVFTDGRALAQGLDGTVYAAETQGQFLSFGKSTDDGLTWVDASIVPAAGLGRVTAISAVADRPWIDTGDVPGEIVMVFNDLPLGTTCLYSTDHGATWLTRTTTNTGPTIAGSVELDQLDRVWITARDTISRWSTPCSGARQVVNLPASGPQIMDQIVVTPGLDAFVASPTTNSGKMRLIGVHGQGAVLSTVGMKTLDVSPPTVLSNAFGAVAARNDNEIAVAWYGSETAGDPSSASFTGTFNVYVARVQNFWSATPTITVNTVATGNHVGGMCMTGTTCTTDRDLLDYFGVAYDAAGNVHVAYGHDNPSAVTVRYAKLTAI